jgi:hypothetical protein
MNEFEGWQKILEEWKEVNRMKRLNQELYDMLGGTLIYILEYSQKYNIELPNRDGLFRMGERIHYLMNEINNNFPPNFKHPNGTPKEPPKPKFDLIDNNN